MSFTHPPTPSPSTDPLSLALIAKVKTRTGEQLVACHVAFAARLRAGWAEHLQQLAQARARGALPAGAGAGDGAHTPALERCTAMMREQSLIVSAAMLHNLPALGALFATAVGPGESQREAWARWRRVYGAVGLTPEQLAAMRAHWRAFVRAQRALEGQTAGLVQSLEGAAGGPPAGSLRQMMRRYLEARRSAGALWGSPGAEMVAMITLIRSVAAAMTFEQMVGVVTGGDPHFPDTAVGMAALFEDEDWEGLGVSDPFMVGEGEEPCHTWRSNCAAAQSIPWPCLS